jgi:hypothetical protein
MCVASSNSTLGLAIFLMELSDLKVNVAVEPKERFPFLGILQRGDKVYTK